MLDVGDSVMYADQLGRRKPALVTAIHGEVKEDDMPSINVIFVSEDEARNDTYGRQIERKTSVVHRSHQSAHGFSYELAS